MNNIELTLDSNNQKAIINLENIAYMTGNSEKSKSVIYFNSSVRIVVKESFNEIVSKLEKIAERVSVQE